MEGKPIRTKILDRFPDKVYIIMVQLISVELYQIIPVEKLALFLSSYTSI